MTAWCRRLALPALIVALTLAAACGDDETDSALTPGATPTAASPVATFPMTVERSDGKSETFDAPVERIVSLSPGATEILFAIGAEDRIVAVDNQADYPAEAAAFPTKVDAYEPSIEAIAALEPDLVIVADNVGGIVESLDQLSIPLFYRDLDESVQTIDDVIEHVEILGALTDRGPAAETLASSLRARVDAVAEQMQDVAADEAPSVYHELDSTLYSVAEGSFIGSVYATLKAENIAGDGGGTLYPQLTQEAIIDANPDVIVLADEEFGVTIDSVKARPGWDAIAAVQNDRIYAIDPDIISRPGPRIVDALEQLAAQLYPEKF